MKNIFNGKRFVMLLQKEAQNLRSQYFTLILIVTCVFLVASLLFAVSGNDNYVIYGRLRFGIGNMLIWGSMLFAPFQLYKGYNHKIYGVNYFMLPASQTEKWMSMFFYCVIVTPVLMILSITLIDLCLYPFYPWVEKSLWYTTADTTSSDILMLLAFQSLFFLGNIWFQQAKVQKTIATVIILMVAYTVLMVILGKVSGSGQMRSTNSFSLSLSFGDLLDISQTWKTIIQTIIFLVAPIGLWIVSFIKMKKRSL